MPWPGPAVMAPCAWMPAPGALGADVLAGDHANRRPGARRNRRTRRLGCKPALSALACDREPPAGPGREAMASSQATSGPRADGLPTVILPPARIPFGARVAGTVQCVGRLDAPFGADVAARAQRAGAGDLGARLDVLAGDHRFAGADPPPAMMPRPARTTESTLMPAHLDRAGEHHRAGVDLVSRSTASVGPNWSSSQQASPTRPSATRASSTA